LRRDDGAKLGVVKVGVVALGLLAAALAASACSESRQAEAASAARSCPQEWKAGWQKLANRVQAPVYCPNWMPKPLDARMHGAWADGDIVARDHSYVVSFLSHDASGDVHVIFRGYPGRARIPTCVDHQLVKGRLHKRPVPCFADPHGSRRIGGRTVTLYTVNQDWDQWHLLYAWRHNRSLYTVSEHVIRPLTYRQVLANLDRLVRGLVLIQPKA
jgi:hypothetical protein